MIYNGVDLTDYVKVRTASGLGVGIAMSVDLFTPTTGAGDYIIGNRQPNNQVVVGAVILADAAYTLDEKLAYLHTVFLPGTAFVPIEFDEFDDKTYMGRIINTHIDARYPDSAEITLTFTTFPYRYGDDQVLSAASATAITGTILGSAPSRGIISFSVAGTPAALNITLGGTTGVITLVPPDGDALTGAWEIDLDARTAKLDGVLAMDYVDFATTIFETFAPVPGAVEIGFSADVTGAQYAYTEVYY